MSTDFLSRILDRKRLEVEAARLAVPEEELLETVRKRNGGRRSLWGALAKPGPLGANVIAEVKRGSPSKGVLRDGLDERSYARACEAGGAAALSVLTDETFFLAKPGDLARARSAVTLPVLRKDFLIFDYQIVEAAAMGADAILLIARTVSEAFMEEALERCSELGLDALVEVHSEEDLAKATRAGGRLIGINNRDLQTFKTSIETSIRLAERLKPHQVAVAASGIGNRGDIETLLSAGIYNFLIGESLVKAADPQGFLRELLGVKS